MAASNPPADQPALLDDAAAPLPPDAGQLLPAPVSDELRALAQRLGPQIRFGTSSWHFPGWAGLVWGREYGEATLSKHGLTAYARHPLLRTVSLDRVFYRAVDAAVAKVVLGTATVGHAAFVTINNKAEGSAPLSVLALASELLRLTSGAGR